MLRNVFLKTIRDQYKPIFFWGIGFMLMVLLYFAFWPSVKESAADLQNYVEKLPEAIRTAFLSEDYTSPTGYLNAEIFSFMAPLLLTIFAVIFGSGTLLNEEDSGTINVLLSHPLPRWKVLFEKWAGLALSLPAIILIAWEGFVIGQFLVNINIDLLNAALALFSALLLALFFGTFSLTISAFIPSRGLSVGLTSALLVGSYLLNVLAPIVKELTDFQRFSPFHYYNHNIILQNGLIINHALILVSGSLILLLLAIFAFSRRDLGR